MRSESFKLDLHYNNHNMKEYKEAIEVNLRKLGAGAALATSLVNTQSGFIERALERKRPAADLAKTLWDNHMARFNR